MGKKHEHWITALWWHFGPFGRQDVHVHSCIEGSRCQLVLIGEGRNCTKEAEHWPEKL